MQETGQNSYYLQDDLGSPMLLTDEQGQIRESYAFDEYGQALHPTPGAQLQPLGYTGYQLETTSGLYFAQARRYDAGVGRFVSEDKLAGNIERPYSLNRYGYCWDNPLVFVDLNGLAPAIPKEGDEAHGILQLFLANTIPGVEYEVPIPHSSINGNTGRADIVYTHNGIVEIYEIKPGSYAPGNDNNLAGKAQLNRYISHYSGAIEGTSLNSIINGLMLPSIMHPDKFIKYYVYPSDPGMIYWEYVNRPGRRHVPVKQKEEEKSTVNAINEEVLDDLETVAITGVVIFTLYEVIKWGVAAFFAPPTAGGSLVAAGCLP